MSCSPWVAPVPAEAAELPGVRVAHGAPWSDTDWPDAAAVLDAHSLQVTTMGRTVDEDPLFFAAAAAAGHLTAQLVARRADDGHR